MSTVSSFSQPSMKIKIENGGVLEVFGLPPCKSWRVADDEFLQPAFVIAEHDSLEGIRLGKDLVKANGFTGFIKFRCLVHAQLTTL